MNGSYDDLSYTICLICKKDSDLEIPRCILKAEFGLVEAQGEKFGMGRALVLPFFRDNKYDDRTFREDYVYRVRFNPEHPSGPVIDFKYALNLHWEILEKDPRKEIIKRAVGIVDLQDITDWGGKRLSLSFYRLPELKPVNPQ
jgi:hypothetical protein